LQDRRRWQAQDSDRNRRCQERLLCDLRERSNNKDVIMTHVPTVTGNPKVTTTSGREPPPDMSLLWKAIGFGLAAWLAILVFVGDDADSTTTGSDAGSAITIQETDS
jgi:hypothetical protein